jgi:hypothetical protein
VLAAVGCENGHEVGDPGDLEDLLVMVGQSRSGDGLVRGAGAGEQGDDQGDAGRVDVEDVGEVEQQPSVAGTES